VRTAGSAEPLPVGSSIERFVAVENLISERPEHQWRKSWWWLRLAVAMGFLIAGFVGAGLVWRYLLRR